jgi:hypothetical protein
MRATARAFGASATGAVAILLAGGVLTAAPSSAAPGTPPLSVICPDIGQVVVGAPPALGEQPAVPDDGLLRVTVSYTATNLRTGGIVSAGPGAPIGTVNCGTAPFSARPARAVATGPLPAGTRPNDQLTGRYAVSVTVLALPSAPSAPSPRLALPSRPFPNDAALSAYLASRPGSKSVALFDAATNATFVRGPSDRFVTASIVKVAILGAVLRNAQLAGRGLTATETSLAERMIRVSDNAAATTLWNQIGGSAGLGRFVALIGMAHTTPGPGGYWGLTQTTTPDQLLLMRTVSYPNGTLNEPSRRYARSLMLTVTASQRWGVSAAAPVGSAVALKNGWLPRTGGWAINSIGRISGSGHDFVLAELSFGSATMATGVSTVEGAARIAASGVPHSGIGDRYLALGGPNGLLGNPVTAELPTPDLTGAFTHYEHGSIYWSRATGAHEVHGAIRDLWASLGWERSVLGFPTTDELTTPDRLGRYNHFQGGSIYWTPATGAHEVHGAIRARWASLGWERSPLGYPTSNVYAYGDGWRSDFQHGYLYWHAGTGVVDDPVLTG